ncbi:alanyl-tRNA editing protein [Lacrimispora celerecrescens]|uniref:Alanyl-tRNA synthetase n=1 Tax=Lacrimispora celerecrescens TaxID=29354 RepID=A0A084JK47_9FIRM|nr:alanyl-tRNA editing protein [Lacrimispora celerecrescens]KEZ89331.1 alanyl-tRNA synthetase [Lacrimispora celerecrescens]
MEKLYYDRPYVKTFEAVVTDCRPGKDCFFEVFLDRTAFYPEGGGQPADMGSLGEASVLDVRERPEGIVHITDKPLKVGSRVKGIIDWDRRFCFMQNHSGEHLLSGIVHKHYGLDNVGFHMGKDEVTVDFNGILTMEEIEAVEAEVNELIWQDIPVLESYPSKEELSLIDYRSKKELTGQVRLIEFPGGDVCACCGTHVMTTGEIGILKVTGMIHYKGGVRLTMLCGRKALKDYCKKQKTVSGISVLLSAKPDHLLEAVDRLKEEGQKKDGRLGQLSKELLERKAGDYPELDAPLLVFERDLSPVQLRQFCTMLYEGKKGSVVLTCSGDEGVFQYALGSGQQDMRALSKALNGRLNGRGGGSTLMAQGTFQALQEDIRKVFEEES